ncbi:MAG: sigma-70 family RNA polymerase sigma factor [Bacteroidetes bacterium]|nr:sigma-70 family RNA polymerase sigma factor [Bacteroidota bacterium]
MAGSQNESIGQVVRENGKRLFDFIRNRVREPEEAEDIFQDVMVELTQSYRMMQPIEKMAAWLFRVARNKITDNYRKKRPVLLEDQLIYHGGDDDDQLFLNDLLRSSSASPDREFDQALIWEAVELALDELPKEQRDVFVKHELEGISFKEMVDETGESMNTLLSRKRYAVLALREKLQYLYDELMDRKQYQK